MICLMPTATIDTATCLHFGLCGGCAVEPKTDGGFAPPPYSDQLRVKDARVRSLLAPFEVAEWRPIVPSPDIWHYRNKMEFAFGQGATDLELLAGLRQAGRFDRVVDLVTCQLVSPECVETLARTRAWAKEAGLAGYHRKRHTGDVRYLVWREGKNTGQRMGVLIASAASASKIAAALPRLRVALEPLLTSLWLGLTESIGDVARTESMQLLWGSGSIDERLNDLSYRISPYSFFQTNTRGAEVLYLLLRDWATSVGRGALVDAYCGSGGIGLSLARQFDRVVGVDTNREAIQDAQATAERNAIANTEFVAEDALEFFKKLPASSLSVQISAAVIDPPRPGLHPKALAALLELNPPRLAYVSCNPDALARDLQSLVPLYHIRSAQVIDLFPHTPHVEALVTLEHR